MDPFWEFMTEHWLWGPLLILCAISTVVWGVLVLLRGWPPKPHCSLHCPPREEPKWEGEK